MAGRAHRRPQRKISWARRAGKRRLYRNGGKLSRGTRKISQHWLANGIPGNIAQCDLPAYGQGNAEYQLGACIGFP